MKRTVSILIALTLLALPALAEPAAQPTFSPFNYVTGQSGGGRYLFYGFPDVALYLPIEWEGRFTVEQTEDGAAFCQTASHEKYLEEGVAGGGFLFELRADADERYEALPAYKYLGFSENAGLHFYLMLPSDYPAYMQDDIRAEYDEMAGAIDAIAEMARIAPSMSFYTEGIESTDAGMS